MSSSDTKDLCQRRTAMDAAMTTKDAPTVTREADEGDPEFEPFEDDFEDDSEDIFSQKSTVGARISVPLQRDTANMLRVGS